MFMSGIHLAWPPPGCRPFAGRSNGGRCLSSGLYTSSASSCSRLLFSRSEVLLRFSDSFVCGGSSSSRTVLCSGDPVLLAEASIGGGSVSPSVPSLRTETLRLAMGGSAKAVVRVYYIALPSKSLQVYSLICSKEELLNLEKGLAQIRSSKSTGEGP